MTLAPVRRACALAILSLVWALSAVAQRPAIESISICAPDGRGPAATCPPGTFDTGQIVLAPDGSGNPINGYGGMHVMSDEHSSIFPPGSLQNSDYLFWVASDANGSEIGQVVLSGGSGPDKNGQWTFDFATADGYGFYSSGYGPVLLPAVGPKCPAAPGGNPTAQDSTFDLSYAAPGSVVLDPTNHPGSLLMLYEGCTTCIGVGTNTNPNTGAYITVAVATSNDYGHSWPTYRGTASFPFVPLPSTNKSSGPNAGMGAWGASVCMGNDCTTTPPAAYGRYAVVGPVTPLPTLMAAGKVLGDNLGMGESSAFLDDAGPANTAPYVYDVHGYKPASFDPPLPGGRTSDLMIARAQLNGGTAPLTFYKWNGTAYASPGLGGKDTGFLPQGTYENCGALSQARHDGTINYVDDTQQYLLMFVCESPTDPALGSGSGAAKGAAWFWATSPTLSDPTKWSAPQEVAGTWYPYDTTGQCFGFPGWYATWMSLGKRPGHLSKQGYVFYLSGCEGAGTPGGRKYSSRAFTINTATSAKRRAAHH